MTSLHHRLLARVRGVAVALTLGLLLIPGFVGTAPAVEMEVNGRTAPSVSSHDEGPRKNYYVPSSDELVMYIIVAFILMAAYVAVPKRMKDDILDDKSPPSGFNDEIPNIDYHAMGAPATTSSGTGPTQAAR